MKKRKGRKLLVLLGVLFVVFMLIPVDDEEELGESKEVEAASADQGAGIFSEEMVSEKRVHLNGDGSDVVTVLVYMNGSDLESESNEATTDICEMLDADIGGQVNVLIETMGTKSWSARLGIASDRTQRYKAENGRLTLLDDSLGQLQCTERETLADFIRWGADHYPANRYVLLFWNHGAGPIYGFGYDEHLSDEMTLTVDEIQAALRQGGVYFDFIGMDCCIMSSLELCCALYDYCDYMILSEDFESGLGWSYTGWLNALSSNPSIATEELGRVIVDDMIAANEESVDGTPSTLALIDESYMKVLYTAWADFAYANESALLGENYSMHIRGGSRAHPCLQSRGLFDWIFDDAGEYSMSDYYITDIMAVAQNIDSDEARALEAALKLAIVYFGCTSDEVGMTGLSVTLPYGDIDFYRTLKTVFTNAGIDLEYIEWLEKFVGADGVDNYYDYDSWYEQDWDGWADFSDDFDWHDWEYYDDDEYWDDDSCGWDCYELDCLEYEGW